MTNNTISAYNSLLDFLGMPAWLNSFVLNALSYSFVVVPVLILVFWGHKWLLELKGHPNLSRALLWLIGERPPAGQPSSGQGGGGRHHDAKDNINCWYWPTLMRLLICIGGIQLSLLSWGVLQERMVTLSYGPQAKKFKDSLFLVFGNRSLAFVLAVIILLVRKWRRNSSPDHQSHLAISNVNVEIPYYCYLYAALSNITATWFQYEALKFVTFPLQVLSKTCKIITVMLLGKCVQNKTYSLQQYLLATSITMGVTLFLFGNESIRKKTDDADASDSFVAMTFSDGTQLVISLSGIILLICYLFFDAFTSNWEDRLFRRYPHIDSFDMMCGISFWGTLLTSTALFLQGGFSDAWDFMQESGEFGVHVILLAISSAVGGLFIFYTISTFGAVVFATIMTVRQALAIFLSCLIYGHEITQVGLLGLVVVFASVTFQIYMRHRNSKKTVIKSVDNLGNGKGGQSDYHVEVGLLSNEKNAGFSEIHGNSKPANI